MFYIPYKVIAILKNVFLAITVSVSFTMHDCSMQIHPFAMIDYIVQNSCCANAYKLIKWDKS